MRSVIRATPVADAELVLCANPDIHQGLSCTFRSQFVDTVEPAYESEVVPVTVDLSPVIAATTHWLLCAYPAAGGVFSGTLAEAQARQATTVAAWLRYPTELDAGLVTMVGPGGSARLDWLAGAEVATPHEGEHAWRSWVDEVVASWAACLLADHALATAAVAAVRGSEHTSGIQCEFRRLLRPDERDRRAAALLRHPDLLAPVADLHREQLRERLDVDPVEAA
jgi:hypothetical protein